MLISGLFTVTKVHVNPDRGDTWVTMLDKATGGNLKIGFKPAVRWRIGQDIQAAFTVMPHIGKNGMVYFTASTLESEAPALPQPPQAA